MSSPSRLEKPLRPSCLAVRQPQLIGWKVLSDWSEEEEVVKRWWVCWGWKWLLFLCVCVCVSPSTCVLNCAGSQSGDWGLAESTLGNQTLSMRLKSQRRLRRCLFTSSSRLFSRRNRERDEESEDGAASRCGLRTWSEPLGSHAEKLYDLESVDGDSPAANMQSNKIKLYRYPRWDPEQNNTLG